MIAKRRRRFEECMVSALAMHPQGKIRTRIIRWDLELFADTSLWGDYSSTSQGPYCIPGILYIGPTVVLVVKLYELPPLSSSSIPQYLNTSIPQYLNTAIPQYPNTSIPAVAPKTEFERACGLKPTKTHDLITGPRTLLRCDTIAQLQKRCTSR